MLMLLFGNLHRITIIFRYVKPTFAGSLELPWYGFYKTIRDYKKEAKVRKDRRRLLLLLLASQLRGNFRWCYKEHNNMWICGVTILLLILIELNRHFFRIIMKLYLFCSALLYRWYMETLKLLVILPLALFCRLSIVILEQKMLSHRQA